MTTPTTEAPVRPGSTYPAGSGSPSSRSTSWSRSRFFYVLRAAGVSAYLALLAGALASLVSAGITLVRDRRVNGVAAYMTTMLVLSTLVSLIAGSPRFLLARDAWLTGLTGIWFIASCWVRRPLAYQFAQAVGEGRFGWPPDWEARWERAPKFRRMWRVASVAWGIGTLLDAALRWVMAYTLPIDVVPASSIALYAVTTIVLFVGDQRVLRALRRDVVGLAVVRRSRDGATGGLAWVDVASSKVSQSTQMTERVTSRVEEHPEGLPGWCSCLVAPSSSTAGSAASRSSTITSTCICWGTSWPGHTGAV